MKVEFKSSFTKDLKKVKDKGLMTRVKDTIELVEQARNLQSRIKMKLTVDEPNYGGLYDDR